MEDQTKTEHGMMVLKHRGAPLVADESGVGRRPLRARQITTQSMHCVERDDGLYEKDRNATQTRGLKPK